MNSFIKKSWPFLLGAAIVLTLFLTGSFDRCSFKETEAVIEAVDVASLRRGIIDSMQKENSKARLCAIDSVKKRSDKTISKLKRENRSLNDSLGNVLAHYEADTSDQTPTCDSVIDLFTKVVDNQAEQLRQDSIKLAEDKKEVKEWVDLYNGSQTSLAVEKGNVMELKEELRKQTSSWKKNEKWLYFGAGATIPILLRLVLK